MTIMLMFMYHNGHYNDVACVFEMTMMKADLLMEVWLANMRPDTLWEEET